METEILEAIHSVVDMLPGITSLKPQQESCLIRFLQGQDVVAQLIICSSYRPKMTFVFDLLDHESGK